MKSGRERQGVGWGLGSCMAEGKTLRRAAVCFGLLFGERIILKVKIFQGPSNYHYFFPHIGCSATLLSIARRSSSREEVFEVVGGLHARRACGRESAGDAAEQAADADAALSCAVPPRAPRGDCSLVIFICTKSLARDVFVY